MLSRNLKKIRKFAAILFFVPILLIFIDIHGKLPIAISDLATYFQFIPSLLKFAATLSFTAAGFLLIVGLTLLLGRVYCSFLCPLGILQDVIIYFSPKRRKKKFVFLKPNNFLRYGFLGLSIFFLFTGSIFALYLLDPYSNFGRIISSLFRPAVIYGNNILVSLLEKFGVYSIYPSELRTLSISAGIFSLTFLGLIIFLSLKYGRAFCNTVCPVGTFLGLLSRYSLVKIKIEKDKCKGCGLCERICKANCISKTDKNIDYSRCVNCYDCLDICTSDGIKYNIKSKETTQNNPGLNIKRREFIAGSLAAVAGVSSLGLSESGKVLNSKKRHDPVIPPGAVSYDHFHSLCTACHLCVSNCPTQVLQPSLTEYGLTSIFQPRMDYKASFCNYDCNICTTICPSGALLDMAIEKKKLSQLGKAVFSQHSCIVFANGTDCGACSEHCPTKAVTMKPYKDLFLPEVNEKYCIGCGACEYACPAKPEKAIYVVGNEFHQYALKPIPEQQPETQQYNENEEFPF